MLESHLEAVEGGAGHVRVEVFFSMRPCLVCLILAVVRRHAANDAHLTILANYDITPLGRGDLALKTVL